MSAHPPELRRLWAVAACLALLAAMLGALAGCDGEAVDGEKSDGSASAAGGAQPGEACPGETRPWMGPATVRRTEVVGPGGPYPALAMAPKGSARYPGNRPVVVFQHGVNGDFCNVYWIARYLAGHGFVAFTYTAESSERETTLRDTLRAMRATVSFAGDPRNPFRSRTDPTKVGVGGFSLGAVTASIAQGDREVDAAIVLDNLRRWKRGDPGGVGDNCTGSRAGEIEPGSPALGFAQDAACRQRPDYAPRELKQFGFRHWRKAEVASMELVLRGFRHVDYGRDGNDRRRRLIAYYAEAWFDRWLGGQEGATDRLLAGRVRGRPTRSLLSRRFDSGAYIPGEIDDLKFR